MLRRLLIAPVLVAALAGGATTASAGDPTASVKLKQCSIEDASALFVARMRQVTGSRRGDGRGCGRRHECCCQKTPKHAR